MTKKQGSRLPPSHLVFIKIESTTEHHRRDRSKGTAWSARKSTRGLIHFLVQITFRAQYSGSYHPLSVKQSDKRWIRDLGFAEALETIEEKFFSLWEKRKCKLLIAAILSLQDSRYLSFCFLMVLHPVWSISEESRISDLWHVSLKGVKMLSRDCDGCERQLSECKLRFSQVRLGEKVFCPDGTTHLVDS